MEKFDYCIFIGHFSPYLLGHENLMIEALNSANKVIVVLGSHNKARNIKTPWTSEERQKMILSSLSLEDAAKVEFIFLKDQLYSDQAWGIDLLDQVSQLTNKSTSIALICSENDNSKYLKLFPQWKTISIKRESPWLKPSDIRFRYFTYDLSYQRFVSPEVKNFLESFKKTDDFALLKSDFDYIKNYQASWSAAPFPVIFNTVDAVVIRSGHVLLVRRKGNPGKGQLALPGGFLNVNEEIEDAVIRELKEETSIKLSKEELAKYVGHSQVFSAPERSLRGRTITFGYLFDLGAGPLIPVKGSSDADKAFWLPLNEVKDRESEFFEDHYHIINTMLKFCK